MALALEIASACTDWAQAKKIQQADPGDAPWNVISLEDLEKRFCAAMTISEWRRTVFFDLKLWAMDGYEVPLTQAMSYAHKHCNVPEALLRQAQSLRRPAHRNRSSRLQVPVAAVVTGATSGNGPTRQRGE